MKKIVTLLSVVWLLNACTSLSQSTSNTNLCPQPTTSFVEPNSQTGLFDYSDYQIRNIVVDDTINFQSATYDFVFCPANNTWAIQTGTLPEQLQPPQNYSEAVKEIVNPSFKSINFAGETYQYRVRLEPNYSLGEDDLLTRPEVSPENDRVVFELTSSNKQQPQQKILYTLEDLQAAAVREGYSSSASSQLGIPQITAAVTHGQRIWWAIAFEQGEGNNGIATIVSYQPQTNQFTLFQPQEIATQQITDLVVTGDDNTPTLWLGTKISGEGNPTLPAYGLVAYRPVVNPHSGNLSAYTVHNSPLIGAIPTQLEAAGDTLWASTGNGICQLQWQTSENFDRWLCWRFALMAKLPSEVPIYRGLLEQTPAATLSTTQNGEVEVLWSHPLDYQTRQSRYEVRYEPGFTVTLNQGIRTDPFFHLIPPGKPAIDWAGSEWHWRGDRFVRSWDEVARNEFGGGSRGISADMIVEPNRPSNFQAMRGDLELLEISANSTTLKHYSGWVDSNLLNPYLTVVPQSRVQRQPNPLIKF